MARQGVVGLNFKVTCVESRTSVSTFGRRSTLSLLAQQTQELLSDNAAKMPKCKSPALPLTLCTLLTLSLVFCKSQKRKLYKLSTFSRQEQLKLTSHRRLLRCVPHTRLDERPQSSQQWKESSAKCRRLLPTYGLPPTHSLSKTNQTSQKSATRKPSPSSTQSHPHMQPKANPHQTPCSVKTLASNQCHPSPSQEVCFPFSPLFPSINPS